MRNIKIIQRELLRLGKVRVMWISCLQTDCVGYNGFSVEIRK